MGEAEGAFAARSRNRPTSVVPRSAKSVGPNAGLVGEDFDGAIGNLKPERRREKHGRTGHGSHAKRSGVGVWSEAEARGVMLLQIIGSGHFNILPHAAALAIAYALAFPIGWNREKEERSAGLRTFPLVAVASCGVIQASEPLTAGSPEAMARIVEGLITGMGFIGGGAILRLKDSVKGTATAASLWVTGAIGAAVGLGSLDVALMLSVATCVTLWLVAPLKKLASTEDGRPAMEAQQSEARRSDPRQQEPTTDS